MGDVSGTKDVLRHIRWRSVVHPSFRLCFVFWNLERERELTNRICVGLLLQPSSWRFSSLHRHNFLKGMSFTTGLIVYYERVFVSREHFEVRISVPSSAYTPEVPRN